MSTLKIGRLLCIDVSFIALVFILNVCMVLILYILYPFHYQVNVIFRKSVKHLLNLFPIKQFCSRYFEVKYSTNYHYTYDIHSRFIGFSHNEYCKNKSLNPFKITLFISCDIALSLGCFNQSRISILRAI